MMVEAQRVAPEASRSRLVAWALFLGIYAVALSAWHLPAYDVRSCIAAWVLVAVSTLPAALFRPGTGQIPFLAIGAGVHGLMFGHGPITQAALSVWNSRYWVPSPESILLTFTSAIVAVLGFWVGFKLRLRIPSLYGGRIVDLRLSHSVAATAGTAMIFGSIAITISDIVPVELKQPVTLVVNMALGCALLATVFSESRRTGWARWSLLIPLLTASVFGSLRGVSQDVLVPFAALTLAALVSGRQRAAPFIAIGAMLFFLIQPVKGSYRAYAWYGDTGATWEEKAYELVDQVAGYWVGGERYVGFVESIRGSTAERLSQLLLVAHLVQNVPNPVPYRYGETFKFVLSGIVPRVLWPEKPIAQQANIDFVRSFNVLPPGGEYSTMVGITDLGEVYWNFGFWGVFPIFTVFGIFVRYLQGCVVDGAIGVGSRAVGISMAMNLLALGTTISSIVMGLLFALIVHVPLLMAVRSLTATNVGVPERLSAEGIME